MKVIELLTKIANGEEAPKKIKYDNQIYELTENKIDWYCYDYAKNFLGNEMTLQELNNKVEVIEEDKKIKKLENLNVNYCRDGKLYETLTKDQIALDISTLQNWVNKIIDILNKE